MSSPQNAIRKKIREGRLELVAQYYKRGYSFRKIQAEVIARLSLEKLSIATVKADVDLLLKEWRDNRLADMDDAIQVQLEKIDDRNRELWEQWERSKTNIKKTAKKKKGTPGNHGDASKVTTTHLEETETEVIMLGDVSYLTEIRNNEAERSKLLGLYAPEKKDLTGDLGFLGFLMESGAIDNEKDSEES